MFDLGWSEMGIILLVALLVLGPKEMPKLARDLGRWIGKARALAREFQRSLEDMAREAELDDVKKQIDEAGRELRRPQLTKRFEREVDPEGELLSAFDVEGERGPAKGEAGAGGGAGGVAGAVERGDDEERAPAPASSGAAER
ncbi:MAG: Sec-independent protein translocase protein TatB [Alphaproteobacteria bacterium]